jgi:hypothetical protein
MLRKATFRIAFSSGQFRLKRHARLAPRLAETGDIPYNSFGRILGSVEFKMKIGNFVLPFQKQCAGFSRNRVRASILIEKAWRK